MTAPNQETKYTYRSGEQGNHLRALDGQQRPTYDRTDIARRMAMVAAIRGEAVSVVPVAPAIEHAVVTPDPDKSWTERAKCRQADSEAFFPEKGGSTIEAKRVCRSCPVRMECLQYALANDERFGVWGGLSERERRKLKKRVTISE